MSLTRLLLLCSILLCAAQTLFAQAEPTQAPEPRPSTSAPSNTVAAPKEPQITFSSVHVEGPYVAMTFDDGPNPTLTPKLLDLLAAHHMKATFFVVGENAAEHPEILKRAVKAGHEIANHSRSHPNLGKMGDDAV